MIGVDTIPPNEPRLLMVIVDPLNSASVILLSRAAVGQSRDLVGSSPTGRVASACDDDRNHQPLRRLRGDAEMHRLMAVDDTVLVVVAGVHLREVADGDDDRAHQERQHGQPRASVVVLRR